MHNDKKWLWISSGLHALLFLIMVFGITADTLPEPPSGEIIAEIELTGGGQFITKEKSEKTTVQAKKKVSDKPDINIAQAAADKKQKQAIEAKQQKQEEIERQEFEAQKKVQAKKQAELKKQAQIQKKKAKEALKLAEAEKAEAKKRAEQQKKQQKEALKKKLEAQKKAKAEAEAKKQAELKKKKLEEEKKKKAEKEKRKKALEAKIAAKLQAIEADKRVTNAINAAQKPQSSQSGNTASSQNRVGSGLPLSDKNQLVDQMTACWTEQGASHSVIMDFDLNRSGIPFNFQFVSGNRIAFALAQEAVKKCGPYNRLPASRYAAWKNLRIKFAPFGIGVN